MILKVRLYCVISTGVAEFSAAAHELALETLGYMVDALPAASREHFQEFMVEQSGTLRVNNYPLCPQPALHTGLPPHIDACMVTILHQPADVPGLEVEKDGSWVGVQPRHDALVVIVGAIVQARHYYSIFFEFCSELHHFNSPF